MYVGSDGMQSENADEVNHEPRPLSLPFHQTAMIYRINTKLDVKFDIDVGRNAGMKRLHTHCPHP